jgi:hypothetical protein
MAARQGVSNSTINKLWRSHNLKPHRVKASVWTATVESIVEKLSRCRQTLEQIQPGCTLPRRRKVKS